MKTRTPIGPTFPDETKTKSTRWYKGTVAQPLRTRRIAGRQLAQSSMCEELKALKCEAGAVLRRLRLIRRSRDVSFYEDAELTRLKHASINKVVKHLLVGHNGQPCPSGERPIVSSIAPAAKARAAAPGR